MRKSGSGGPMASRRCAADMKASIDGIPAHCRTFRFGGEADNICSAFFFHFAENREFSVSIYTVNTHLSSERERERERGPTKRSILQEMGSGRRAIASGLRLLLSAAASSSSPSTRIPALSAAEAAAPWMIGHRFVDNRASGHHHRAKHWTESRSRSRSEGSRRAMSCCAGLGSPPPREIIVEYTEEDYTDDFIKLANAIEEAYPEFIVSGNPNEEEKPRKGAFEITSGDILLFSKLKTKRMPELLEVLKAIKALPPIQCPVEQR